jgi:hypothetical protein
MDALPQDKWNVWSVCTRPFDTVTLLECKVKLGQQFAHDDGKSACQTASAVAALVVKEPNVADYTANWGCRQEKP